MLRLLAAGIGAGAPAVALLDGACGNRAPAVRRGSVSYALSVEPKVLNPLVSTLAIEGTVMSLLFPGLVRVMPNGTIGANLAQSYEVQDGGLTYRFLLRPGLTWEDGAPLTSRDWAYTHRTIVDPASRATSTAGWDEIDRVDTPDDRTIVMHVKKAFAPFLLYVGAAPVLPEHVLAQAGDAGRVAFNRQPVGCGPFKLARWDTASQILLQANDRFFRGRPKLDQFVFKVVPDATVQLNELRTGAVDIVSIAPSLWQQARSLAPAVATVAYEGTTYTMVQYDEYRFLKDVRVRQALDYATPKQMIAQGVLRGLATVAYADVPPGSPYFEPRVEHHDHDLDRARSLLRQAGFTLQNGVQTKDGSPLAVPISTISTSPSLVQVAEVLRQSWLALGVQTGDVTTMETSTLFSGKGPIWNGSDAAVLYSWGQGIDPYDFTNWSSTQIPNGENDPGENLGRYVNAEMDQLVVDGGLTVDLAARKGVYSRVQQILARDVPVTFLYWQKVLYAHAAWLSGFSPNAFSGPLWNASTWS
jgi:peptide/nickel transport system substrate-binding protein